MLLKTKDGISCDTCCGISKDAFVYFSVDSTEIVVDNNTQSVAQRVKDLDIDMCNKCYDELLIEIRKHIGTTQPNTIKCDLCPQILRGSFIYHRAVIHKVSVDRGRQDNHTMVENNVMDVNIDDKCFKKLINTVMEARRKLKVQGDWS